MVTLTYFICFYYLELIIDKILSDIDFILKNVFIDNIIEIFIKKNLSLSIITLILLIKVFPIIVYLFWIDDQLLKDINWVKSL